MPSVLNSISAALKKALNETSVPDLSASAEQVIRKAFRERLPTVLATSFETRSK
jgi:hypothetical protein